MPNNKVNSCELSIDNIDKNIFGFLHEDLKNIIYEPTDKILSIELIMRCRMEESFSNVLLSNKFTPIKI